MSKNIKYPSPDPKKFASFQDYERAVKMHEEFVSMSEEVSGLLARTKTEEEFNQEMEKLGYTCHEDEYCENEWCQKNEECLAIALEAFQDSSDEFFFWKMLPEKEKVIHLDLTGEDCNLPESWKASDTKEGKVIQFCLAVEEALLFENTLKVPFVELVKRKEVQDFGRVLYLFLQETLTGKEFSGKREEIQKFLQQSKILKPRIVTKLLKMMGNSFFPVLE